MIWNEARECMSRDELAVLQGRRLVELVKYMYDNAGYYMKKMRKIGLEPGDIREIGDLPKLPFTTREDLIEAYPAGLLVMSNSRIVHYYGSDHNTGFAGRETLAGYTQHDMDIWKECMARSISMAGLGEEDVIQVGCSYGVFGDGIGVHGGAQEVGATVIPASDYKPAMLGALMRRLRVTGIVSPYSYLMRVAKFVEKRGMKNMLRLKAAVCGGGSGTESVQKRIQDRLGIKVYDIFGLDELTGLGVACECACQNGLHIQEDYFLAEVVDAHKLLVLPGGVRGELVFTTLQKEGIPLIRYRTMSHTKINYEKCECGRTMARMDKVFYGENDVLQIRGNDVPVSQIDAALSAVQDREASYILYVRKEHNYDVVDVYIVCAEKNGAAVRGEDRRRAVADAVAAVIGTQPVVYYARIAKSGALCGTHGEVFRDDFGEEYRKDAIEKRVTIVDERKYRQD